MCNLFGGVQWSSDLAILSNSDKHRTYVEISPALEAEFDVRHGGGAVGPSELSFDLRTLENPNDPRPAHRVLLPILEGVSAVLNRFILEEGGEIVQFEAKSVSYLLGDDDASPRGQGFEAGRG
jgi:hypothetical protein